MEAVAAADKGGLDRVARAILGVGQIGSVALYVVQSDVRRLVDDLKAASLCCGHEITGHLRLAVDHHLLAGELLNIDADQPFAVG
ncbi:hypothetical protein D9M73_114440 [compost metagenome]